MRILGIDYGDRRTGVSVSDELEFLANAVTTIKSADIQTVAQEIAKISVTHNAKKIVIGLPKNMDGTEGFRAKRTRELGNMLLQLLSDTEIIYYDERMTTMAAAQYMNITGFKGKKRKANIDMLAADIILQDYLDSKR